MGNTTINNDCSKTALRIRATALILLLLMPISALGTRFGLWPYTLGLLIFAITMLGSLLIQIINAIWLRRKPALGTRSALRWASLFALPPLIIVASIMRNSGSAANIHNISTDTVNPPQFDAAIIARGSDSNPLAYSPEIAAIQQQHFPAITPIHSGQSAQQAFSRALIVAETMGWKIINAKPQAGLIEAVDSSFWFGFKDDIVIRIQATDRGSRIDLRSVSRVGRSDMGTNAQRIVKFSMLFND